MPYKDEQSPSALPRNRIPNMRRRITRLANKPPLVTCAASRHLQIMADELMRTGEYGMIDAEPEHCAVTMYAVIESLWRARHEIARLKKS